MKKRHLILGLAVIAQSATAWPLFTTPNWQELQAAGALTNSACPAGFAQIRSNASIPVKLVNQHPIVNWHWRTEQASTCFNQSRPLPFISYGIDVKYDPVEHHALYSIIDAHFINTHSHTFKMRITTPKKYWDCHVERLNPKYVTCANDI